MSPIFPQITDFKAIIEQSSSFIDEYWFENLNLRGSYKQTILSYIAINYPLLADLYNEIYISGSKDYWCKLAFEIEDYCKTNSIKYTNYFYHEKLVKAKKANMGSFI